MTGQSESGARRQVLRTYLEMRDSAALRGEAAERPGVRVDHRAPCRIAEYRALYRLVGEAYAWRDRLAWTDERLGAHLARPEVEVWVLTVDGATAGYFELEAQADGTVEILYFGIAAPWHGRGLGRDLLVRATHRAWERGATRVCLNTCTLDGPYALPNYLARGFVPYREETYEVEG
jgi:ribosomal protein S18 acetylase RimI-like enzyme